MTRKDRGSEGAAVWMKRPTEWARVTGPDRVTWLQGMVSNDVERLGPGDGCRAAHLDVRGKVIGLMRVFADAEALWIAADQDIDHLASALDRLLIMEDAEIETFRNDFRTLTVAGPEASPRLERALGTSVDWAAERYSHRMIHSLGADIRVIRGEVGFDVVVPAGEADALTQSFEAAGIVASGDDAGWSLWSLEAGIPVYGMDVNENTILSELGEEGIDYEKGCYIGQEVVAKIKYIGHVNRHLVGLRLRSVDPANPPAPGTPLSRDGREIGTLTRAAYSARADGVIALATVRHGNQDSDSEFLVGTGPTTATIAPLPFVTA